VIGVETVANARVANIKGIAQWINHSNDLYRPRAITEVEIREKPHFLILDNRWTLREFLLRSMTFQGKIH
jgi:hypothetical protein